MLKWSEKLKWLLPKHTGKGETLGRHQTDSGAVGCTRFSVFSAVSPQGDGARGCRDAKSHAGLHGAAWMLGPILMLVSLATSLIHLSRNHDRQTTRFWDLISSDLLSAVQRCRRAPSFALPRECSHLSCRHFQTVCCVPGLLRECCSSFFWPFILEWMIFVFCFLLYLLESSTFCFFWWLS